MNLSLISLIKGINNSYMRTKNLELSKILLNKTDISEELFGLSAYNMEYYVRKHQIFFNKQNYNKLIIDETDDLEFCLITWNENALTKLHTHSNECLFRVFNGEFEQTTLSIDNNFLKKKEIIKPGDSKIIKKGDFHQMLNLTDNMGISFHVYNKN